MACFGFLPSPDGGYKRCRNWACLETELDEEAHQRQVRGFFCSAHNPTHTRNRSFRPAALRSRLCVGFFGSRLEHKEPWRVHWIEELLASGYLQIRKEDVEKLEQQEVVQPQLWPGPSIHNYSVFLLLIARHVPEFQRSWAPRLWACAVQRLWRLRQSYGPLTITDHDIASLICVKGDMAAFVDGLRAYPDLGALDGTTIGWNEVDFYRFFDHVMRIGRQSGWSDEWILEDKAAIDAQRAPTAPRATSPVVSRLLQSDEYHAWRAFQKKEWSDEKKARIQPFKEELIAITWHPDRFLTWCLDLEEHRDLTGRWDSLQSEGPA